MPLSDLEEPAELVYRVRFQQQHLLASEPNGPQREPSQSELTVGTSGLPNEDPSPAPGPLLDATGTISDLSLVTDQGLVLTITRSQDFPNVITALICSLSPIPEGLRRFHISADFQLEDALGEPIGTESPGNMWAASVVARDADAVSGSTIVGATHQVRVPDPPAPPQIYVTLGVPPGALSHSPTPAAVAVTADRAHDGGSFTVGAYFDCMNGTGQSTLRTGGGYYWENTWTHPFWTLATAPKVIRYAGFGLAMAKGTGVLRMLIKELRVLNWPLRHLQLPRPPIGPNR